MLAPAPSEAIVSLRAIFNLARELYYGQFNWNGKIYEGKHKATIDKSLYDRTQAAMGCRQKPKLVIHECTFGGVLGCGSIVYLREEKIEAAFAEALKQIAILAEAVELTQRAMIEEAKVEQEYHGQALRNLNSQIATLQRRMDCCYEDRLEGRTHRASTQAQGSRTRWIPVHPERHPAQGDRLSGA